MKRRIIIGVGAIALLTATFAAGAVVQPRWITRGWIAATSRTQWERNNRLGMLLKLGMPASEVERIMGAPTSGENVKGGVRWRYSNGACCSDLIVEFKDTIVGSRLVYACQDHEALALVPNPAWYTLGRPVNER